MKDITIYKRWFIKIVAGATQGMTESIYYRNGLTFHVITKWQWYFKYRAALYTVKFPKHYCEILQGSYDYVPPKEQELKRVKDLIQNRKAEVTKWSTKIRMAEQSWCNLFSIAEEPAYIKAIDKIEFKKKELKEFEKYQYALENNVDTPKPDRLINEIPITSIDKRY